MTAPTDADLERLTVPGHDRDCARVILAQARLSQARNRSSPLDDIQVRHLLQIGHRAGLLTGYARGQASMRDREHVLDAAAELLSRLEAGRLRRRRFRPRTLVDRSALRRLDQTVENAFPGMVETLRDVRAEMRTR